MFTIGVLYPIDIAPLSHFGYFEKAIIFFIFLKVWILDTNLAHNKNIKNHKQLS